MKVGEGESDFGIILGVSRVVMKEEVAEKNKVTELLGVRTIKCIWFFYLWVESFVSCFSASEFTHHQQNCFSEIRSWLISKWIFQRIFIMIVSRRVIIWLSNEVGRGPGIFQSRSQRSLMTSIISNKGTSVNILICYLGVHGVMGHKSFGGFRNECQSDNTVKTCRKEKG